MRRPRLRRSVDSVYAFNESAASSRGSRRIRRQDPEVKRRHGHDRAEPQQQRGPVGERPHAGHRRTVGGGRVQRYAASVRVLVTGGGGFLARTSWSDSRPRAATLRRRRRLRPHPRTTPRGCSTRRSRARVPPRRRGRRIGANRANPGRYWFANLAMGANVLEQARLHATPSSSSSARSAPTRSSRRCPSSENDLWDGYPEETNAPYGVAKKAVLVGRRLSRAVRPRRDPPPSHEPLRAPRQLRSRDLARDPALIRKMVESDDEVVLWGDGSPTREFLYVDDCVEGLCLRRSATTGRIQSTSVRRARSRSATSPSSSPT